MEWTKGLVRDYGLVGLAVVAFAESSFFPIPPDALLLLLVLPPFSQSALLTSLVCTLASVSGAALGWVIGRIAGRPLLDRFFSPQKVARFEWLYERYGIACVFTAAFTPIPYKLFTIASGVFRYSLPALLAVSVVGRGARFFLVGYLGGFFGERFLRQLDTAMWASLAFLVVALAFYWVIRHRSRVRSRSAQPS